MSPFLGEFQRYRGILLGAVAQVDAAEFSALAPDGGSMATILKHLAGNLRSRYTDFLTSDGEKPWRDRDGEFVPGGESREALLSSFEEAFAILHAAIRDLTPADRERQVTIRGLGLSVDEALCRSLAHFAYHTGQIVTRAKDCRGPAWRSLSIPLGESAAYNSRPNAEREAIKPG